MFYIKAVVPGSKVQSPALGTPGNGNTLVFLNVILVADELKDSPLASVTMIHLWHTSLQKQKSQTPFLEHLAFDLVCYLKI